MIKWVLLCGKDQALDASDIERDKYDVFSKSYLNRLVWYYKKNIEDFAVVMPITHRDLAKKITCEYTDIKFYEDTAPKATVNTTVLLNTRFVIADESILTAINESAPTERAYSALYKDDEGQVVMAVLSSTVYARILEIDSCIVSREDVFNEIENVLKTYFGDINYLSLKKKKVINVKTLDAMQRFMSLINRKSIEMHMKNGAMIWDKKTTWIEPDVLIGVGTIIYPGTIIRGQTVIGQKCLIGPSARIENSQLGDEIAVRDSTILSSKVDNYTTVGPYAYLRPESDIGKNVKVGDFVEVKNARIDDGSKVSHLSYIGDGSIGKNVNIGCGVVFVNYDGINKHKTVVEDNAFVGCNANLIAPVTVKTGAYVAAGSTITDEVTAGSLAIARSRQVVKANWMANKQSPDEPK